jgi:ubiquinone/menaquinone biosynthesis C-methylase UbiE
VRVSGILKALARLLAKPILRRLSDDELQDFLVTVAKNRAESLSSADGLRFLFGLDASLYPLQGWLSVDYGGGIHTKHRHTRYHDFFVRRIRKGERILDIGCGIGVLAYDVAEKAGAYVVGIDISADNIETAFCKHSHSNVTYQVGDALKTPLEGSFDVVILSNVLEHLDARSEFLRRMIDLVHPARVLLRVPIFERDWRVPLKQELGIDYRLDPTHCTEYTLESFASEMKDAGLKVTYQEVRWGEIWAEAVSQ